MQRRRLFVVLALSTIGVGLAVHWWGGVLPVDARDVLGDALWAMMIAWWIGAAFPRARLQRRGLAALALCWMVEAGQLYRAPAVQQWRGTALGHLVLGSDFDARDLLAYTLGVLAALLLERQLFTPMSETRPADDRA